jgi:hypothetical protein
MVSLCIPFIVVETIVIPIQETAFADYELNMIETGMQEPALEVNWLYVMLAVYTIGLAIMIWRFGKNLNSFRIQQEDEISSYKTCQLILRHQLTIPHSFLKRIFVSKKDHESSKIPTVVLEHEKAHLDQKHSLDILFIELLMVLLWFNPLLYLIRYSMKLNHEFLADRSVLNQGISTTAYQQLLLDHATTSYQQAMANTFTFPIIKKRFHIMKTHTSPISLLLRSLALIPVLALLVMSCGKEETEFQEVEEIIEIVEQPEVIEVIEVLENLTSKDIKEYNFLAKRHQEFIKEKGHVVLFNEDTKRMQIIFNSMNEKQRAENEPWPYINWENDIRAGQIPPPPPPAAPSKDF